MLTCVPSDRRQGSCANCYAWAATAAIEMELFRRYGIQDRLSIQYFNFIYRPLQSDAPTDPCCANSFSAVLEHYKLHGRMIPWANPNAGFKDERSACDQPRAPHEAIGMLPNYRVKDVTSRQIETRLWSDEETIEELKHVLSGQKAVISKLGGHYVVFVGYDATAGDPLLHHWLVLDSGGVSPAMPDGTYRLPMRPLDYNSLIGPGNYHYQFDIIDVLDLDLQAPALPAISVRPAKAELAAGQGLSLAAHVGGRPPVTYQWEKDGHPIPGQTASILTLASVGVVDGGSYRVRVTNAVGTAPSDPVLVTVAASGTPALTVQPLTAILGEGARRDFQVLVSGLSDSRVVWTLAGGGGELTERGANLVTYRAPNLPGAALLQVRSVADPSLRASLPITVKSADLNGDGELDVLDLAVLAQAYRSAQGDLLFRETADLNGDGLVDDEDAEAFLARLEGTR
jgi:hypothetical protein